MSSQADYVSGVRRRLLTRRGELVTRHIRAVGDLLHRHEPLLADADDQAVQLENEEALREIAAAAQAEIGAIDAALERLTFGMYGLCAKCGESIPAARLLAIPHATTCAGCADG